MGMQCIELFSDRLFLIDRKRNKNKEKLLIEFQSDATFHSLVDEWFTQHPDLKLFRKIKVDQIETCKQLMSHGIGMAVLPESSVKNLDPEHFTFQPLIINNQHLSRPTWLCYAEAARELPQVEAFLKVIEEKVDNQSN
ncbi:substrate-binding domain-containing protein [Anaerobacillus sp. CMMVII]|uniref:substrate-binding domain-containing protein n=1 Tax=Anaerobacillus sp. CMMVII TaxID=2755588 RepID=UPI0021B765A7|nr:substrate-binding domain-containing protein [Anaerobacillus sp. CMMVII]MCT8138040.1 substrate-binding domain-containing protein [Anaerobacillus sp. CMMVII]